LSSSDEAATLGFVRRRLAILVATLLAAVAAATATPATQHAQATALKTCSSGWKHAVIGGVHKCVRAGQFCSRRYDSQYRHYGYRCTSYDSNVARYRLTHA
jgi:hypothetical protein